MFCVIIRTKISFVGLLCKIGYIRVLFSFCGADKDGWLTLGNSGESWEMGGGVGGCGGVIKFDLGIDVGLGQI